VDAATGSERRVLIDELIKAVEVHEDHLDSTVRGAPGLNVTLTDVGLGGQGEERSCRRGEFARTHTAMLLGSLDLA
jgi:hypothetical protein